MTRNVNEQVPNVIPTPVVRRQRGPRPRDARLHPAYLTDGELLALVLEVIGPGGQPQRGLSAELLSASAGLGGLCAFVNLQLHCVKGPATAGLSREQLERLAVALELGRRASHSPLTGCTVRSHHDVQSWAAGHLAGLEHEEVWVLVLGGRQQVRVASCVARGGMHGCGLLPADVLRPVLRCAANAFILVHNHPSGDPSPSRDDVLMTQALQQACFCVGITLLDHVIVSRSGSYSLGEAGVLDSTAATRNE